MVITRNTIAIALNNHGVHLLENGMHVQATKAFKSALFHVSNDKIPGLELSNVSATARTPISVGEQIPKRRRLEQDIGCLLQGSHDSGIFVYCHTFSIMPHSCPTDGPSSTDTYSCDEYFARDAAVMLYNLAMIKHLKFMGSLERPEESEALADAVYLYKMVHAVVAIEENLCLMDDPFFCLVIIATCNNLAQIFFSLGHFKNSSACLAALSNLLTKFTPDFCSSTGFVSKEDMAGFFLNLALLSAPSSAAAA